VFGSFFVPLVDRVFVPLVDRARLSRDRRKESRRARSMVRESRSTGCRYMLSPGAKGFWHSFNINHLRRFIPRIKSVFFAQLRNFATLFATLAVLTAPNFRVNRAEIGCRNSIALPGASDEAGQQEFSAATITGPTTSISSEVGGRSAAVSTPPIEERLNAD
jgi:hypothetical protein